MKKNIKEKNKWHYIILILIIILAFFIGIYIGYKSSVLFSPFYYYSSTPTPTPYKTPTPISNDFNRDGRIDLGDPIYAIQQFNPNFDPDEDEDGFVGIDELIEKIKEIWGVILTALENCPSKERLALEDGSACETETYVGDIFPNEEGAYENAIRSANERCENSDDIAPPASECINTENEEKDRVTRICQNKRSEDIIGEEPTNKECILDYSNSNGECTCVKCVIQTSKTFGVPPEPVYTVYFVSEMDCEENYIARGTWQLFPALSADGVQCKAEKSGYDNTNYECTEQEE